jgi:hypothetical protein
MKLASCGPFHCSLEDGLSPWKAMLFAPAAILIIWIDGTTIVINALQSSPILAIHGSRHNSLTHCDFDISWEEELVRKGKGAHKTPPNRAIDFRIPKDLTTRCVDFRTYVLINSKGNWEGQSVWPGSLSPKRFPQEILIAPREFDQWYDMNGLLPRDWAKWRVKWPYWCRACNPTECPLERALKGFSIERGISQRRILINPWDALAHGQWRGDRSDYVKLDIKLARSILHDFGAYRVEFRELCWFIGDQPCFWQVTSCYHCYWPVVWMMKAIMQSLRWSQTPDTRWIPPLRC